MISVEKPGSPSEILEYLEHHGVKGQKWGVRKAAIIGGGTAVALGLGNTGIASPGVAVAAGITFAALMLKREGHLKASALRASS